MADDVLPPRRGVADGEVKDSPEDGSELEPIGESDDDDYEEEGEEEEEEPPPPMWEESGSEVEEEQPRPPPRASKKKTAPPSASAKDTAATSGKSASSKPAAAAGSSKRVKARDGDGADGGGRKEPAVSPLWMAFEKSRDGADRLGITSLKKWQAFATSMSRAMPSWYEDQVLPRGRKVPQAISVDGLPTGFPEFCHWVAAGNHNSCGATLKGGFEPFAVNAVKEIEALEKAPVASRSMPPQQQQQRAAAAGGSTSGSGRGGMATHASEARRRTRGRKGGAITNVTFAQKMQSAITELEGINAGDDEGSAASRAARSGQQAEDQVRDLLRGADVDTEASDAKILGPAFADSRLPSGTLAMLSYLKRARSYRRRAERQHECLESELEKCLGRLARVEGQYLALQAETTGREATLQSCLCKARPLVNEAFMYMGRGDTQAQALDAYDEAIKLLEAHVEKAPAPGQPEDPDNRAARHLLGVALCNRSVVCYRLGDAYSGKRAAERAAADCPGPMAHEQLKRSQAYQQTLTNNSTKAALKWPAFAIHP